MKASSIALRIIIATGVTVVGGWLFWAIIALTCYQPPNHNGDATWAFWLAIPTLAVALLLFLFREPLSRRRSWVRVAAEMLFRVVAALAAGSVGGFVLWLGIVTYAYDAGGRGRLDPVWYFWSGFSAITIGLLLWLLRARSPHR
jgi:hypothetical protein